MASAAKDTPGLVKRKRAGRPQLFPHVKAQLEQLIGEQDLQPGVLLESEKQLCVRFGVSRPLVRKALSELAREGRVTSVPGKGHFVADPTQSRVEAGAIVCLFGSRRMHSIWHDSHVAGIAEGLERAVQGSPHRLLFELMNASPAGQGDAVKPQLSDLRGVVLVPLADVGAGEVHGELTDQPVMPVLTRMPATVAKVIAGRPAGRTGLPCVYVDHRKGMGQAMAYLLGQGHRRIGYVGQHGQSWPEAQRLSAYCAHMEEAGTADADLLVLTDAESPRAEQDTLALLERAPNMTALVVSAGAQLSWVLRAIERRGLRVGEDLSLVTYDDVPAARQHLPAITVVRQPTVQLGTVAAEMLLERLADRPAAAAEVVLDCELVVRDSVRPVTP